MTAQHYAQRHIMNAEAQMRRSAGPVGHEKLKDIVEEGRSMRELWVKMKERCEARSSMEENDRGVEASWRRSGVQRERGNVLSGSPATSSSAHHETNSSSDQSSSFATSSSLASSRLTPRTRFDLVLRTAFGKPIDDQVLRSKDSSSSGKQPRSNVDDFDDFDDLESVPDECDGDVPQDCRAKESRRSGIVARPLRPTPGRCSSASSLKTIRDEANACPQQTAASSSSDQAIRAADNRHLSSPSSSPSKPPLPRGASAVLRAHHAPKDSSPSLLRSASGTSLRAKPGAKRQSIDPARRSMDFSLNDSDDSQAHSKQGATLHWPTREVASAAASHRLIQRGEQTARRNSTNEALHAAITKEVASLEADLRPGPADPEEATAQSPLTANLRTPRSQFAEVVFKSEGLEGDVDDLFLEYYAWRGKRGLPVNSRGGKYHKPKTPGSSSSGGRSGRSGRSTSS